MERDYVKFPKDDNGDVLWAMAQRGDTLTEAREIDFSIVFQTEEDALQFAEFLLVNRQKVSLSDLEDNGEYPYDITAHVHMLPTHSNISEYEALLNQNAGHYNGYIDGWGCFELE
ncbi:ribonuclease E inhibitor RraB [Endozoicomonas sp. Mp262]|uniref:ribonuclease E inhibitor RraB n=1 Tax=Endozoicomonas sp. Mp262 TaxID=2919499 RepID=UPI0021DAE0E1